jgi:hypothetical protein
MGLRLENRANVNAVVTFSYAIRNSAADTVVVSQDLILFKCSVDSNNWALLMLFTLRTADRREHLQQAILGIYSHFITQRNGFQ